MINKKRVCADDENRGKITLHDTNALIDIRFNLNHLTGNAYSEYAANDRPACSALYAWPSPRPGQNVIYYFNSYRCLTTNLGGAIGQYGEPLPGFQNLQRMTLIAALPERPVFQWSRTMLR